MATYIRCPVCDEVIVNDDPWYRVWHAEISERHQRAFWAATRKRAEEKFASDLPEPRND